eukprot:TRINITY_DN14084_c0_g1_i1.p1 TRINITY_DN14084_c0_g1~~TRINITY_DN14084_c0_g1_i1.p1  ORF type:complete len:542 (+),score=59.51 TRINITY_DN14084_c0_g1_i1:63-1688(+)
MAAEGPRRAEYWPRQGRCRRCGVPDEAVARQWGCSLCESDPAPAAEPAPDAAPELTDEPSLLLAPPQLLHRFKSTLAAQGWFAHSGGVVDLPPAVAAEAEASGAPRQRAIALTPEGTRAFRLASERGRFPPELTEFAEAVRDGALRWRPDASPLPPPQSPAEGPPARFTFAELFAGIGGFRIGLEALGGRCVFASEIDPAARRSYLLNHGGYLYGDVRLVRSADLPQYDMLVGGFPCQSFSTAGQQKGLADPRGALFWQCVRLLRGCRPRCFLFENVAGLATAAGGAALQRIVDSLAQSGYRVWHELVDCATLLPQTRKRLLLCGLRNDLSGCFRLPVLPQLRRGLREVLEREPNADQLQRLTLTDKQWEAVQGSEYFRLHPESRTVPLGGGDLPAQTLQRSYHCSYRMWSQFVAQDEANPRFFTPVECRRLQGFPEVFSTDDGGHEGGEAAKEGRWYAVVGNAVPPPMVAVAGGPLIALAIGDEMPEQSERRGLRAALSLCAAAARDRDAFLALALDCPAAAGARTVAEFLGDRTPTPGS